MEANIIANSVFIIIINIFWTSIENLRISSWLKLRENGIENGTKIYDINLLKCFLVIMDMEKPFNSLDHMFLFQL